MIFRIGFHLQQGVVTGQLRRSNCILNRTRKLNTGNPIIGIMQFLHRCIDCSNRPIRGKVEPPPTGREGSGQFINRIMRKEMIHLQIFNLQIGTVYFGICIKIGGKIQPAFFFFQLQTGIVFRSLHT